MLKKALLVTIFRVPNFGSVLQAYATQKVIESLGWECSILNYNHNASEWAKSHGVKGERLKRKIGLWLGIKASHRMANKLTLFIKKHLHLTPYYTNLKKVQEAQGHQYDVYITGSDQVWNPRFTNCDPFFLLQFADEDKKRISYASSFASNQLDSRYTPIFQRELAKYTSISVRESQGVNIVRDLGAGEAQLVLDPTLLLNAKEWSEFRTGNRHREPFILLYMMTYAYEPRPYIYEILKYYQEKLQCKIIVLEGYKKNDRHQQEMAMVDATDSSIGDFLDYFAQASLVVTSSFHGTAFALNFGVPLISVVPNGKDDRQSSLLKQAELQQCKLHIGDDFHNANPFYDKAIEQERLDKIRQGSLLWLKEALE